VNRRAKAAGNPHPSCFILGVPAERVKEICRVGKAHHLDNAEVQTMGVQDFWV